MQSKYRNKKVTVGAETFDSRREYERYRELVLLMRAGKIHDLHRQVKFELIPAQKEGNKVVERAVYYIADFVYWIGDEMIVEDAKGYRTDTYKLKKKLLLYRRGIKIQEV